MFSFLGKMQPFRDFFVQTKMELVNRVKVVILNQTFGLNKYSLSLYKKVKANNSEKQLVLLVFASGGL